MVTTAGSRTADYNLLRGSLNDFLTAPECHIDFAQNMLDWLTHYDVVIWHVDQLAEFANDHPELFYFGPPRGQPHVGDNLNTLHRAYCYWARNWDNQRMEIVNRPLIHRRGLGRRA
jgi:hypothetical protein